MNSPQADNLSAEVRAKVLDEYEKGNYRFAKKALKEEKIFNKINSELNSLKSLIEREEYGNAINLIVTINGDLSYKFIVVNPDKIKELKSQLDSLRIELYKSKKG